MSSGLVRQFEDLVAWQMAADLVSCVYEISSTGAFSRDFALRDQIRKSAISISSNIAEGFERNSRPDFRRFLVIAKASCGEFRSQLHLALRLGYIPQDTHDETVKSAELLSKRIGALRSTLEEK